jgi:uncharacterized RDD family membrane protein YckC
MSNEFNPYQASDTSVAPVVEHDNLTDASKGRRFGTFFIDYIGYFVFSILFGGIIGLIIGLTGGESGMSTFSKIPEFLLGLITYFGYYMLFEGIWGRTPGKWICGTKVVMEDGSAPSPGTIFKRTACRFIPFEAFSFFGEKGWHDSISDTRVVTTR